jgi:mannose-6-phosphate isomerase
LFDYFYAGNFVIMLDEHSGSSLYPLKFVPILKERLWGGNRLGSVLDKKAKTGRFGESWELSGVPGNLSQVGNGFLKGNNLQELVEVYMGDLVGEKVYNRFGTEFPVLIKFIDAQDDLSIQVHPDDQLAAERHYSNGKTEMWYVMEACRDSTLVVGFNRETDKAQYQKALQDKALKNILNFEKVSEGDVFFIPAGRIHAIGKGVLLAEIQQTSDVTYRIYDWERVDAQGRPRELHTELAVDAIDFKKYDTGRIPYRKLPQATARIMQCPYFTANMVCCSQPMEKDYQHLDSFVIYVCISGKCIINNGAQGLGVEISKGETVLIPASLASIQLVPSEPAEILEVYMSDEQDR